MAPPPDHRRPIKRAAISDQQRRREVALRLQADRRSDAQNRARQLASSVLSLGPEPATEPEVEPEQEMSEASGQLAGRSDFDPVRAARLRGPEVRKWFARQLMLPEWMVDVPPSLDRDWYVFPRPSGKRCFVVSSNGTTISRLRNGSILHRFPSNLPNGARAKDVSGPASSYSILDCIFHEPDETYYVIDMVCWRGYSLYDCTAEFRFFWLNSKLSETGASDPPSQYHRYRFNVVQIYECNLAGLQASYSGQVPYVKDGLLFFNKHAHYQAGNTPLALVWKDNVCSQYVLDTDSKGQIPSQQQVVLELQNDGNLTTSDDPPVALGSLSRDLIAQSGLRVGNLVRVAIKDERMRLVDGKLDLGELQLVGKTNHSRAFADTYSKVLFQHAARHAPLRIEDLVASIQSNSSMDNSQALDVEMEG
ncbi:Snurportin-1 [Rhynchospora pubera]|uniref:Snurportin-1 n=1 Tax=Rhynchospora pubera TaxID=906938 RepID=A0AAV8FZH8_9POAL|nr:Snurportin-1 [Rhynchospora pubera]